MNKKKLFKGICVISFYYLYSYLFLFLFLLINIDISKIDNSLKILILTVSDVILAIILYFLYQNDLKREFKLFKENFIEYTENNVRYWLIGLFLMSVSNYLITYFTSSTVSNNEEVVRSMIDIFPIYSIFSVLIIAPLTEEIVFRKTFKDAINNKYLFLIISAIAFGLIHIVSTYQSIIDLLYIIPYGIFGYVFAYMYYKTNTIFSSISMHFLHNAILLVIYFISNIAG